MAKFYGMKTWTTNLKEYLPDSYYDITHTTTVEMLVNEDYINNVHTTQISTCKRFVSICFDTRETLLTITNTEHSILPDTPISFQPDFHDKIRISIENLPIELPDKKINLLIRIRKTSRKDILPWHKTPQQILYHRNKSVSMHWTHSTHTKTYTQIQ